MIRHKRKTRSQVSVESIEVNVNNVERDRLKFKKMLEDAYNEMIHYVYCCAPADTERVSGLSTNFLLTFSLQMLRIRESSFWRRHQALGVSKIASLLHLAKLDYNPNVEYTEDDLNRHCDPSVENVRDMYITIMTIGTLLMGISAPLTFTSLSSDTVDAQYFSTETLNKFQIIFRIFMALTLYFSTSATFMASINYMSLGFWLTQPEEKLWFMCKFQPGLLVDRMTFSFIFLLSGLPFAAIFSLGVVQSIPLFCIAIIFFIYDFTAYYVLGILVDVGLKQYDGCASVMSELIKYRKKDMNNVGDTS